MISQSDIRFRLSGGASNADPNASLGGQMSGVDIAASMHNLFDVVNGRQAELGYTDYRCLYVLNNHGADTYYNAAVYISVQSPSPDTEIFIGVGSAPVGGVEQEIESETQLPAGVVFSRPTGLADALLLGDIPAGKARAVWVMRVVSPGAAAFNDDHTEIVVTGDSPA